VGFSGGTNPEAFDLDPKSIQLLVRRFVCHAMQILRSFLLTPPQSHLRLMDLPPAPRPGRDTDHWPLGAEPTDLILAFSGERSREGIPEKPAPLEPNRETPVSRPDLRDGATMSVLGTSEHR
jgi:hypothetical protein